MDVVLDSNAYVSDFRMESIKFKNLFDYLRRTKSCLVVPKLVVEETVGKLRYLLDNQSKKTASAIQELNKFIINRENNICFSAPDAENQIQHLRDNFRMPAKGVTVKNPDTDKVDVTEVFMRGVNRRRPANIEGEELRDVIIWLIVLQYAEAKGEPIALVTADRGFWDDSEIHKHILEDVEKRRVKVHLYRTIEDFVKDSAPAPVSVTAEYISKFFDIRAFMPSVIGEVKELLTSSEHLYFWPPVVGISEFKLVEYALSSGTAYEINPETKFLEFAYNITFLADITSSEWTRTFELPPNTKLVSGFTFPGLTGVSTGVFGALGKVDWPPPPFLKQEPQKTRTVAIYTKLQMAVRLMHEALCEIEINDLEILKAE